MVGLSLVLILLALTVTFSPKPGGEMLMRAAALPLSVDLDKLESAGPDDNPQRLIERLAKQEHDVYQVTDVEAVDGAPDLPSSTFRLRIKVLGVSKLFGGSSKDVDPVTHIRERFGRIGDWTVVDVL